MYLNLQPREITIVIWIAVSFVFSAHSLSVGGDVDLTLTSEDRRQNSPRARRLRLEAAKPLLWMHIPKTGTSFANTLLFTACSKWPRDAVMDDAMESLGIPHLFKINPLGKHCPGGFASEYPAPVDGGHFGLSDVLFEKQRGHIVGMFRRPENRILSAFSQPGGPWGAVSASPGNITQYAVHEKGCMTKSLARDGWYPCKVGSDTVSPEEIRKAVGRLQGFAFIGLTEEWNLSICLFHAMFGGDVYQEEVSVTRASHSSARHAAEHELYSSSTDWKDHADDEVYNAAAKIFWGRVKKYNIRKARCQQRLDKAFPRRSPPSNASMKKTSATSLYVAKSGHAQSVELDLPQTRQGNAMAADGEEQFDNAASTTYGYSLGIGMGDGDAVHIRAQGWAMPIPNDNSFAINLRTIHGNIALSYGARYWERKIVLNSKVGAQWGQQKDFPIWPHAGPNGTINISFVLKGTSWGTLVNGTRLHELTYTYPDLQNDPVDKVEVSVNLVNCVVSMSRRPQ